MATNTKSKTDTNERRFPDQVLTDNKGLVRITLMNPEAVLIVQGHKVIVRDIPLSFYTLNCGHTGRGIALSQNDVVFCSECERNEFVARARG
jgi:hypothetical protein